MRAPAIPGYLSQRRRMILESGGPDAIPDLKALDLKFTTGVLDPRITFTRASSATYFNGNGRLSIAGTDQPRFDYDPDTLECKGLLIEEARTNLLTYSEQFDNVIWTQFNVTKSANQTAAPDGTISADKLTDDAVNNTHHVTQTFTLAAATNYVVSVFVKTGTSDGFGIVTTSPDMTNAESEVVFPTGAVSASRDAVTTSTPVGNGWFRVTQKFTTVTGGSSTIRLRLMKGGIFGYSGIGEYLYVWGAQLETGAFPTSYIPTVASQVTRDADQVAISGTKFSSWYNQPVGTFYVEASSPALGSTGSDRTLFYAIGSPTTEQIRLGLSVETSFVTQPAVYANTLYQGGPSGPIYVVNESRKVALAYEVNNLALVVNGGTPALDTVLDVPTLTYLRLGDRNGAHWLNGHIRRFTYYNTRLPNTTLQVMTA